MKFFRLLARILYWRTRALKAEHRLVDLSVQAEAEKWRNQSREDMFVSAAVMGSRGMMGIPPRGGPADIPVSYQSRLTATANPMLALTHIEKMEYQTQWLQPGRAVGHGDKQIEQDFLRELTRRKQFNDEPVN